MKQYEEEIKEIIDNTIFACEGDAGFEDYEKADNLATMFSEWVNSDVKEFIEAHGHKEEIKAIMDKCAGHFEARISDAVDSALSQAEEALKEEMYEIEEELFGIIESLINPDMEAVS